MKTILGASCSAGLCGLLLAVLSVAAVALEPILPTQLREGNGIIKNKNWAIALGKALFWDQQVGSDGMACASCHFSAGADSRITGQLNPGFEQIPNPDFAFGAVAPTSKRGLTASGSIAGPAYTLRPTDFPFHQLADMNDRNSEILLATNDVMSSLGTFDTDFERIRRRKRAGDKCTEPSGDIFHSGGYPSRQVEPRNTPTTINAVFFDRLFWDGRANNIFNGVGVFGLRDIKHDPKARILVMAGNGDVQLMSLAIPNSSLASQAMAPPVSDMEMSCQGRNFADIGRKMLAVRPLARQAVHPNDSVLGVSGPFGDLRAPHHKTGLSVVNGYDQLIERAFDMKYWGARGRFRISETGQLVRAARDGYSQKEINFGMFWGLAVMMYESTLISDQSPFDTANAVGCFKTGFPGEVDKDAVQACVRRGLLSQIEADGFVLFNTGFGFVPEDPVPGKGGACAVCHSGTMFSAAVSLPTKVMNIPQIDRSGNVGLTLEDLGFSNIGSRPFDSDVGLGGQDPYGNPLSFTRQYKNYLIAGRDPSKIVDGFTVDPCLGLPFFWPFDFNFDDCRSAEPTGANAAAKRVKVDGSFKTPTLRNVALTPPYFHYGGYATLTQVVEFYVRGGNRRDKSLLGVMFKGDDTGTGPLGDSGFDNPGEVGPDGKIDFGTNTDDLVIPLDLRLGRVPNNPAMDQRYGIDALVAFMKMLTDARVQCDVAPFDHPELHIVTANLPTDFQVRGRADDVVFSLPAVGKGGYQEIDPRFCIPNAGDLFARGMGARIGDATR